MDSQQYFTQLAIPLARNSPNMAPRRPIEDAIKNRKLNKEASRFEQSFRTWYTAKMAYQKRSWDELVSMSQLVSLFRRGNQLLQKRSYGCGWYVRPVQPTDGQPIQTAMNIMTFHSQVSESKLMAVNPTVNMRPGDDTPEAIASAQACRPVVDYYESQWYTAKFSRREAIRFLTEGMVIHQVRWNPFKGGMQVPERSVSKREQVIDPGEGVCADCKYEADADDFPATDYGNQCPQCGSQATTVRPAVKDMITQIGMGQPKAIGEPEIITSSLLNWRWDLKVDLEMSTWAIKRQRITHGVVKLMLGDMTIPDSPSSEDYGLRILDALTYSGQSFQGSSATTQYGTGQGDLDLGPTMFEAWLGPEDQAEIECDEGETVCGVTMPKGRLSNTFKGQPICVVGLNDGALIIGTFANESQREEVVTAHWLMDADSGAGRGMEDTAGVQKRRNVAEGQVYQGLGTSATPPVFIDMRLLKEDQGQYLFQPGVNQDINMSMLPPNMKMSDAIYMPAPGAVNQQYINYATTYLDQMANLSSFAVEFSDLLSIDNRTATGAQISNALANSLYGPMLMSKGESRVEIAKKIIRLQACYGVVGRYFPGKGNARGRMVDAQSLKGQVIFELVPGSELPTTPYSKQSDTTNLITAFGGALPLAQLKQLDPVLFKALIKPFSIQVDEESSDEVSTLCLKRLDSMKSLFESGVDDPAMVVSMMQPPLEAIEPKLDEKALWMSNYLDLEAGQRLPMIMRKAVVGAYWAMKNAQNEAAIPQSINQGLVAGVGQAAAAAPAALGAQALGIGGGEGTPDTTAQDHAHEAEMQQRDQELEDQHHLEEQDHEARLKAMEIAGQAHITKLQGDNAVRSAKIAGENAVRVAKARPKPKPTKAA